ncbi:sulfatase-like hydrolase/transferase [Pseudomaricurvus alcaniphilus]|uniref:sulfatase-like hydrolase/transferase n=1 Tax=Pseudomaricurvus alcaniphilus TaxID=1166482 RepID=UPI0014098D80|nr:sulfatase-like hydrolase/transferase [Pseudomaricurvus alcaniphilus]NHN38394.1 sulfatase-like hydrolase/transferase [Pseudomaricurvus alcaniphilus]
MIRIFFVFVIAIPVLLTGCNHYPSQTDRTSRPPAEVAAVNRGVSLSELERPSQKPNILWIITDDQRPDSISAYNRAVYGTNNSPLGYVESPNVDKLAAQGVLFTKAFNNSPVCGPSRGSMHSGRYPFRNGHYAFELTHQEPDFVKPTVSQTMRANGYATSVFGKSDSYIYKWGPGQGFHDANLFDYKVHFKHDIQQNGFGDLYTKAGYNENNEIVGYTENVQYPDGEKRSYYLKRQDGPLTKEDIAGKEQSNKEFDLIRSYTRGGNKDLILAGVNPKPAGETVDAYIVKEMISYLENSNRSFKNSWDKTEKGADTTKPQFINLGFHLPHTPVLPPKSFRDRFKDKVYEIPDFDKKAELEKLPPQLLQLYNAMKVDGFTDEEKQQAIRDYYAFCAYGDSLIGDAVEAFIKYSTDNNQEYLIIFAIGDHGWHLGEQGIEAKFGPWVQSVNNAAIVVSSIKKLVPANRVNHDLVEFVDFAPTILNAGGVNTADETFDYLDGSDLIDVLNGKVKRDYILGEINLVYGPRAYLHTERFRFSMRTRPHSNNILKPDQLGKDIKWGLTAPVEDVEMALYDLKYDPLEKNNVANSKEYQALANWFRSKLGNIVLGDGRIEADWSQANVYHFSDFAKGADDKRADIPVGLIPD